MGYTSAEVKNRYNNKVYGKIGVMLPKDTVTKFKERCVKLGVSQASVVQAAVEQFLAETDLVNEGTSEFIKEKYPQKPKKGELTDEQESSSM